MGKFDQAFSPGDIMRRLHELEERMRELTAGRRLESAAIGAGGIRVHSGGNIRINGGGGVQIHDGGDLDVAADGVMRSANFDGDIAGGDAGTVGWALGRERLALLGAFAVPVEFGGNKDEIRGFAVDQGGVPPDQILLSVDIPVPVWADEALVFAFACATLENTSATTDFAYLAAAITWQDSGGQRTDIGSEQFVQLDPGRWGNLNTNSSRIASISGGPLTIDARMRTDTNNWPSAPQNLLDLDGFAVFRRVS